MKKFFLLAVLVLSTTVLLAETGAPSVKLEMELVFGGIGFAFKTGDKTTGDNFFVSELHIAKIKQVNLDNPQSGDSKSTQVIFVLGDETYPVKIIKPELEAFEADIVKVSAGGADQPPLSVPIGHITLKISKADAKHVVGAGKLMIQTDDKNKSGEFSLYLNEIPQPPTPKSPKK